MSGFVIPCPGRACRFLAPSLRPASSAPSGPRSVAVLKQAATILSHVFVAFAARLRLRRARKDGRTLSKSDPVARVRARAFEEAAPELAEHAQAIRALGERVLSHVLEIGERLSKARALIAHGDWLRWLEAEFGWSDETARRFMSVFEMNKSHTVWNLDLPLRALYLLARRSTPAEIREEIIERSRGGERFSTADVEEIIAEAKAERSEAAKNVIVLYENKSALHALDGEIK